MKFLVIALLGLTLASCLYAQPEIQIDLTSCIQQDWISCGIKLGSTYFSLHKWNDYTAVKFLGNDCVGSIKGGFHRWQWKWSGEFKCPALTSIVGSSTQFKSRDGAIQQAITDFMQKALAAGVIKPDQIKNKDQLQG